MKNSSLLANTSAVSEIVGGTLLVLVAVIAFITIYAQMLPVPLPPPEPNVHLMGYVTEDGTAVIEHMGGETLTAYEIYVSQSDETNIYTYYDDPWEIGGYYCPQIDAQLFTEEGEVGIAVYSIYEDGSKQIVFDGALIKEEREEFIPLIENPMLISTLRTDTTDEDLICYDNSTFPENASTYIFRWMRNGASFTDVLMLFDTENSTIAKDYSGNGYDGIINGATWTEDGKVGGGYYFSGASDYITLDLPSALSDISNNDFTICIWVKSSDITSDHRMVVEGGSDNKNFALIFQFGSEIHFGICEDGVKRALRTETLSSDTLYHIGGVWDASEKSLALYVNGLMCDKIGYRNYASGVQEGFDFGHGTASSRFWFGYMDDLRIFYRALSENQIYQIYRCTNEGYYNESVIVSEETIPGDIWQCIVIPSDGIQDMDEIESNILQIVNYSGGE